MFTCRLLIRQNCLVHAVGVAADFRSVCLDKIAQILFVEMFRIKTIGERGCVRGFMTAYAVKKIIGYVISADVDLTAVKIGHAVCPAVLGFQFEVIGFDSVDIPFQVVDPDSAHRNCSGTQEYTI
jgi:hypothetical protein